MDESILIETTIQQYIDMLKLNSDPDKLKEIDSLLSSKIQWLSDGFDLHLFQLNKDYLLLMIKAGKAMYENDFDAQERYMERANNLLSQIKQKEKKQKKNENSPYKSFLEWLLALKKFYGSSIDKGEDLLYLISATEQMLKYYNDQNEQLEKQKAK